MCDNFFWDIFLNFCCGADGHRGPIGRGFKSKFGEKVSALCRTIYFKLYLSTYLYLLLQNILLDE